VLMHGREGCPLVLQERRERTSREVAFVEATRPNGRRWPWPRASPRHAHADVALEGNALLATHGLQIAGIAVAAVGGGQRAGDAPAAFERGAPVAPCLDAEAVEADGVEAIGAPPYVALEIGLPYRAGAAESPPQQRAYAPGEHVGAVERDGRETLT